MGDMSKTRPDAVQESDDGDAPQVPAEVLEAIENLAEGDTASKDEIESVLKF